MRELRVLRDEYEWPHQIWIVGADWEEQINQWKKTAEGNWETSESEFPVEGGEVCSDSKGVVVKLVISHFGVKLRRYGWRVPEGMVHKDFHN